MCRKLFVVCFSLSTLFPMVVYGQEKPGSRTCADVPGRTSATHRFQRLGETIEIPLRSDDSPAGVADCEPVALSLHWSNGRNNGSHFKVTFLDINDRPIYGKQFSGFLTGVAEFPLSSFNALPLNGSSLTLISVPSRIIIQAVRPFAAPAILSYSLMRVARASRTENRVAAPGSFASDQPAEAGNEIVSIHQAVRLIGSARLLLIQIELQTDRPFPVKAVPLRLQIGKTAFTDELSGDHTGRKLTLSLTPEQFAELKDGEEIVAFFDKTAKAGEHVWNFGKLRKAKQ